MLVQLDSTTYIDADEIVFIQRIISRDELIIGLRGGFSVTLPYAKRNLELLNPYLHTNTVDVEVDYNHDK